LTEKPEGNWIVSDLTRILQMAEFGLLLFDKIYHTIKTVEQSGGLTEVQRERIDKQIEELREKFEKL